MSIFNKSAGNPQEGYTGEVNGSYKGGHPLYPEKIKRSVLRIEPELITLLQSSLNPMAKPTIVFTINLSYVETVKPEWFSFIRKDTQVNAAHLYVIFYDEDGGKHQFIFSSENQEQIEDVINKLKSNFYLLGKKQEKIIQSKKDEDNKERENQELENQKQQKKIINENKSIIIDNKPVQRQIRDL